MNYPKSEIAKNVAFALIKTKAIILSPKQPFTWASGWQSPIYCDNRKTLSYPNYRELISLELIKSIKHFFAEVEVIAGVATAGIPQAAILADRLKLPLIYVRDKPKSHGMENRIEGELRQGQKCLVVEDLISSGGSSVKAIEAIRDSGGEILGLISTFNYGFDTAKNFLEEKKIKTVSLCSYSDLLPIALEQGIVLIEDIPLLEEWRKDPATWGK